MSETPFTERRSFALAAAEACLILVPAALFSLKSDLPHVFAICALVLGFSLLKRKAVKFGDRPVIYFMVVSLSLATFLDMAIPMNDSRTGVLDILVRSSLTAPALLYMAAFATLFEQKPVILGVVASFCVASMIAGGDIFRGSSLVPERIFFAKALASRFTFVYMAATALETACLLWALHAQKRHDVSGAEKASRKKTPWARSAAKTLCVATLPFLAALGVSSFYANEKSVRQLEKLLSFSSFIGRSVQQELPFPSETDISKAPPKEDPKRRAQIVARVKASRPPELLRARAYVNYADGRWSSSGASSRNVQGAKESEAVTSEVFWLPGVAPRELKKLKRMEVFQSSSFSHDLLLSPANALALEIVADKLTLDGDGMASPSSWKPEAGFIAFVDEIDARAGYREPEAPGSAPQFLEVPEKLASLLAPLAEQAKTDASKLKAGGDAGRAEAVASLLRNRCRYSLETKDCPQGVDPVENFLFNTKSGHCELFASAATLLLRELGIPARYVTGMVCDERHPSGSYYVARLGSAHAWCEAFFKEQGRWVVVEASPASAFENMHEEWGAFESLGDWTAQIARQGVAWLQRGYFAQAVIELLEDVIMGGLSFASSKAGAVCGAALALGFLAWLLRKAMKALKTRGETDENLAKLRREFKRAEARAVAKSGEKRAAGTTLREWAAQAESSCGPALPKLVAKYEELRFREKPPSSSQAAGFAEEARKFRP